VKNTGETTLAFYKAVFSELNCTGNYEDLATPRIPIWAELSPMESDQLIKPFSSPNYTIKFVAPNEARFEELLVTFTDKDGNFISDDKVSLRVLY
jgi:hypothetical protein